MTLEINGPWKVKKKILKYKNPWMEVSEHKVIRPDGKDGIYGEVRIIDGVSMLPIDEDGFVYLTKQFRYTLKKEIVEVPSGGIDKNEKPLEAAKRELKEELGIVAKDWIELGLVDLFTTIVKSNVTLYLARNLSFTKTENEGTENIKMVKIKLEKAIDMVINSKITGSDSCVLILKVDRYLKGLDKR